MFSDPWSIYPDTKSLFSVPWSIYLDSRSIYPDPGSLYPDSRSINPDPREHISAFYEIIFGSKEFISGS